MTEEFHDKVNNNENKDTGEDHVTYEYGRDLEYFDEFLVDKS